MTVRPRNYFATLRGAFWWHLRAGARRYLTFGIFGGARKALHRSLAMPLEGGEGGGSRENHAKRFFCTQGSNPEEFEDRGKQKKFDIIMTFVIFALPAPGNAREAVPGALGGTVPLGVVEVTASAKTMPNDFPDDCATSEPLCYTQDSFWEESGRRGKQISGIRYFR